MRPYLRDLWAGASLVGAALAGLAGALAGMMGVYFGWKFFALYLPNRASVLACLPSGGTCSIDGFANLEISGLMAAVSAGLAAALLAGAYGLLRLAGRFQGP